MLFSAMNAPQCPKCQSDFSYEDGSVFVCPSCAHEWPSSVSGPDDVLLKVKVFKDAHGNILEEGDTISVIKDLKINGSSEVVKMGTKVKGIRLVDSDDGHDIDCKIPGFGAMKLKSEFVKKAK